LKELCSGNFCSAGLVLALAQQASSYAPSTVIDTDAAYNLRPLLILDAHKMS
jgi:hypothetical protein